MGSRRSFMMLMENQASGPTYETPAYENAGGTGDRTALITVTSNITPDASPVDWQELVNGLDADATNMYWNNIDVTGKYIQLHYESLVLLTELKLKTSGGYDGAFGDSTWKIRGSINGTDWIDLCVARLMVGAGDVWRTGSGTFVFVFPSNAMGYSDFQIYGAGGSLSGYMVPREVECKIGNPT